MKTWTRMLLVSPAPALALSLALSGCGGSEQDKSLSSGVYERVSLSMGENGCNIGSIFQGTGDAKDLQLDVGESSLVAHLPGSSLTFAIDGARLSSFDPYHPIGDESLDFTDPGLAACLGLPRPFDCKLHDASDMAIFGNITELDQVTFINRVRFEVASGTECAELGQLAQANFAGVSFPCETIVRADYRK